MEMRWLERHERDNGVKEASEKMKLNCIAVQTLLCASCHLLGSVNF